MSAGTADPQAAWRWLVFLTRQPPADPGAGLLLPARRSVAASRGFWDGLDDDLAAALRYAADHSLPWHPAGAGDQALDQALAAILGQGTPVEEALAGAQAQALAELEAIAGRPAAAPTFALEPSGSGGDGAGAEVITFLVAGGAPAVEPHLDLAARFQQDHPGIVVDVATPGLEQRGLVDLAAAADCFEWGAVSPNGEAQAAILSLDPLLEADPAFPIDDVYPQLLGQFRSQGQLWGLPSATTPYVIEYNKDLFDAAGVDYPAPGWTPDDFLAAAVALTEGEGQAKQYGFVGQVYEYLDLLLVLDRLGARLVDDRVEPPAFTFDDPATVEAVAWYAALATEYGVKPVLTTDPAAPVDRADFAARDALIDQGRAAMWTTYGPNTDFVDRQALNLGVVPLPAAADGAAGSGYLRTNGYYISATTVHRQACWSWITFLSGQVGAARGLPARRSVAESDAYRRLAGDERAGAYLASLEGGEDSVLVVTGEAWLGAAFQWLYRAYGQVLLGESGAGRALQAAQRLADDYRACVVERDAAARREAWQACLAETDPGLEE
jgi:multiple sugar transport system substrate-binding protein